MWTSHTHSAMFSPHLARKTWCVWGKNNKNGNQSRTAWYLYGFGTCVCQTWSKVTAVGKSEESSIFLWRSAGLHAADLLITVRTSQLGRRPAVWIISTKLAQLFSSPSFISAQENLQLLLGYGSLMSLLIPKEKWSHLIQAGKQQFLWYTDWKFPL